MKSWFSPTQPCLYYPSQLDSSFWGNFTKTKTRYDEIYMNSSITCRYLITSEFCDTI